MTKANYSISEKKCLKKMNIPDFRHMSKDKLVKFASMMDRMDPEVVMAAINQFPVYTDLMKELANHFQNTLEIAHEKNEKSQDHFYQACDEILAAMKKQLEEDDLTPEEKTVINSQMIEVARMISEKDSENKRFLLNIQETWKWLGVGGIALGAMAILRQSNLQQTDIEDEEDPEEYIDAEFSET
ncbi:hypothetical protein [uncultured Faecalibaculum sp.]|uniref:hypothetical protein n=1 Tax=uncultured Faecalibaculum sp. TaxID=1729681 RepID=UPI002620C4A6|nr:hypothetical protein [uncultured Faecalibaculum sp.]